MKQEGRREANIELLRVLCCLMVLVFHVINTCIDLNNYSLGTKILIGEGLYGGGRVAVNVFVIIGAWFLCESNFSIKRIRKLFVCNLVYQLVIGMIFLINGQAGILWLCKHLFSITTNQVWFISAYLVLLLIAPLLNEALRCKNSGTILFILFIIFCVIPTFYPRCSFQLSDMAWFALLYMFTGYLKRCSMRITNNISVLLLSFFVSWTIPVVWTMSYEYINANCVEVFNRLGLTKNVYISNLNTLPAVISSFALFFIFRKVYIESNKLSNLICFLSATTLDIYIIFSSNSPHEYLWWIDVLQLKYVNSIGMVYVMVLAAFVWGVIIGRVRINIQHLVEQWWNNMKRVNV